MNSTIHRIEQRSPDRWILRAIIQLTLTMDATNDRATLHAVSILRSALEECQP